MGMRRRQGGGEEEEEERRRKPRKDKRGQGQDLGFASRRGRPSLTPTSPAAPAHQLDTDERHEELPARVPSDQSASPLAETLRCRSCRPSRRASICEGP